MKTLFQSIVLFLLGVLFLQRFSFAQYSQAMDYLNYPQSIASLGMGEQGVALLSNNDALVYNPANLVFTDHAELTYFVQPFYVFVDVGRIISLHSMFEIKNVGYFGISYQNWSQGEFVVSIFENPAGNEEKYKSFDRNISVAYARNFSKQFSAGLQVRYSYLERGNGSASDLLISTGFNYQPECLSNKFNLGFSLTNFGPAVKYESSITVNGIYDPPPSNLNLGVNYLAIENPYFSLPLNIGISKIFDKRENNGEGQSSFKTLFSDWKDFPRDVTVHSGLAFKWKPLDLGSNVAFFQEFYLGNFTGGPKTDFNNFFTHGFDVGFSFSDIKFTVGYAGRWYNSYINRYLPWKLPWETFQFTLSVDENYFLKKESNPFTGSPLNKIILTAGIGNSVLVGKYSELKFSDDFGYAYSSENKNSLKYFIEAAFYLNEYSALVTKFSYSSIPWKVYLTTPINGVFVISDTKHENLNLSSLYRIHPVKEFVPIYIEVGLGVQRTNPIIGVSPKYHYRTFFTGTFGANFNIYQNLILSPRICYILIFERVNNNVIGIGGFNQFDFDLSFGYEF